MMTPESAYRRACWHEKPFPEGEAIIATSAEYSFWYSFEILKKPFPLGENIIATDAEYSWCYAHDVLHGPFSKGEKIISKSKYKKLYPLLMILYKHLPKYGIDVSYLNIELRTNIELFPRKPISPKMEAKLPKIINRILEKTGYYKMNAPYQIYWKISGTRGDCLVIQPSETYDEWLSSYHVSQETIDL